MKTESGFVYHMVVKSYNWLVVVGAGAEKQSTWSMCKHKKKCEKGISINRDTNMSSPVTGGLNPNGGHKLMVNHSHSWLLPCGPGGIFWIPGFSRPPCMTDAIVVAPAVVDMLAALARVTGAWLTFGVACPASGISLSLLDPTLLLVFARLLVVGKALVDARDCLL